MITPRAGHVVVVGHLVDEQPQRYGDLRGREAYAVRGVHRLEHVGDELTQAVVEGLDQGRRAVQHRLTGDDDGTHSHGRESSSRTRRGASRPRVEWPGRRPYRERMTQPGADPMPDKSHEHIDLGALMDGSERGPEVPGGRPVRRGRRPQRGDGRRLRRRPGRGVDRLSHPDWKDISTGSRAASDGSVTDTGVRASRAVRSRSGQAVAQAVWTRTGAGRPTAGIPSDTAGLAWPCSCRAAHASPPGVRRTRYAPPAGPLSATRWWGAP